MSLSAKALTTLDNVKQMLNITTSDKDAYLERLIESVSVYIEAQTGRVFLGAYSADVTEYPDPVGRFLFLKASPIKSITSIKEGTTPLSYTDDDSGDYRWERFADEGMVERAGGLSGFDTDGHGAGGWMAGERKIKVIYKGGYASQSVLPADLVIAADSLVAEMFKAGERTGVASESMGSYSVSYQDAERVSKALPGFLATIERYRIPLIA